MTEVKNFYLLPIAASLCFVSVLYSTHKGWLVIGVVIGVRICWMKRSKLIWLTVLFSFLLGIRTWSYVENLAQLPETVTQAPITILRDTVVINGSSLRFTGKYQQQKVTVSYRLKDEAEKKFWQTQRVQQVKLTGENQPLSPARNLKGFDQQAYYLGLGLAGQFTAERLTDFKTAPPDLAYWRESLFRQIDQCFPKKLASYIKALVLGFKDEHFSDQKELYQKTGLLHLFALSGLHIQFYLGAFHVLLKRLGLVRETRLLVLLLISFLVWGFTGWAVSVLRALLSFLIVFLLATLQLRLAKLDQWSFVLLGVLLFRPLVLLTASGRLSLWLALLLVFLPEKFPRPVTFQIAFSLFMIPLLIFEFSEWSVLGGVFTLLLFPIFQWLLLPGCLLLFCLSFWWVPTFLIQGFSWCFTLLEHGLAFFQLQPLVLGKPSVGLFSLIWFLAFLSLACHKQKNQLWLVGSICLLLISVSFDPRGLVAFVDVGQGDSIFIKLPFKQETFLIDTGGRLQFKQAAWQRGTYRPPSDYNLVPFLKSQGIKRIDHLILTHNDADHMGELENVARHFQLQTVYVANGAEKKIASRLKRLINNQTKVKLVKTGDVIGKKLAVHVVSPTTSEGENDQSIVTFFKIGQRRFLLTGDLEKTGEAAVLQKFPQLRVDVLKVGHHGSNTSTSAEFLNQLRPTDAVISAGRNNRYGHPTNETLKILQTKKIHIHRTDQQGMIYYQWSPYPFKNTNSLQSTIAFLN